MITLHDTEQGSPDWLQARIGCYTGSNAHKLLSSFGASEYAQAIQDSFKGNFHTERGHLLEGEAIELYEQIKRVEVQQTGYVTNDKYPNALYSPDGLTDTHLIEVKCFSEPKHLELINDVPFKVLAQIHFGLLITEMPAAHLVAYNPKLEPTKAFKIIDIKPNRNIQNNFKRILRQEVSSAAI